MFSASVCVYLCVYVCANHVSQRGPGAWNELLLKPGRGMVCV